MLLFLDRTSSNTPDIAQELIANMLGVRREGVTEIAGTLRRAGLIEYHRGHITVLDRAGLEARTCECYWVIKDESERLLKGSPAAEIASRHVAALAGVSQRLVTPILRQAHRA